MTATQKQVLRFWNDQRIGAVPFEGKWIWPHDIRKDADLADRYWATIEAGR